MTTTLENKRTEVQGILYSRYISSWRNKGGDYFGKQFEKWLESNYCTKDEIAEMKFMATCGKIELEISAEDYVKKMKEMINKIENDEEPEEDP